MRRILEQPMRVAVGMSGGVDSTLAAFLLKQEGHEVIGITMQTWDGSVAIPESAHAGCYGPGEAADIAAAAGAARRLGIPHHVIPLATEYQAEVLDYFRSEYRAGRTPNPCVRCNRQVKFGTLLRKARAMGLAFDRFATGHYARVTTADGRCRLLRGVDHAKDQSYFLSRLTQTQLAEILFPLGEMTKDETKALARQNGFEDIAGKPESQDFIESDSYDVLFKAADDRPGPIEDLSGKLLGQHRGIVHYTIGQRKGLGLSGFRDPLHVVRIDACRNAIVVGPASALAGTELQATDMNWIADARTLGPSFRAEVQIRQQHAAAPATVTLPDPADPATVRIAFDTPQRSIAPGQTAVCYAGDEVLGGGVIR